MIIWVTFVLNLVLVKWCTFPFLKEQNCQTMWAYALVITARGSLTLAAFSGFVPSLILKIIPNFVLNFVPNFVLNLFRSSFWILFRISFWISFRISFWILFWISFRISFRISFWISIWGQTDRQTDRQSAFYKRLASPSLNNLAK